VDYLVSKGISEDRLIAQGYGETQPANDCVCSRCTEDEHQENRRTAFKVLGSF
jgi:outer membrane protein OmpA-like peptidoglycan-associated protein